MLHYIDLKTYLNNIPGVNRKKAVKQKFYKKNIYTRRKCTNKISQKYNE